MLTVCNRRILFVRYRTSSGTFIPEIGHWRADDFTFSGTYQELEEVTLPTILSIGRRDVLPIPLDEYRVLALLSLRTKHEQLPIRWMSEREDLASWLKKYPDYQDDFQINLRHAVEVKPELRPFLVT